MLSSAQCMAKSAQQQQPCASRDWHKATQTFTSQGCSPYLCTVLGLLLLKRTSLQHPVCVLDVRQNPRAAKDNSLHGGDEGNGRQCWWCEQKLAPCRGVGQTRRPAGGLDLCHERPEFVRNLREDMHFSLKPKQKVAVCLKPPFHYPMQHGSCCPLHPPSADTPFQFH